MTSTGRRGFVGVDRRWLADPNLSNSALRLALWLDSHTHEYLSALSVKRAADEIGWSRDRVTRTLRDLEGLGIISTEQVPHSEGGKTRTRITIHHEVWSDQGYATPRGRRMPHGEAEGMPHGEAATTSNPTGEESKLGVSVVHDDLSDARRLCEQLADSLEQRGGRRPNVTDTWLRDMDRLLRIDGRQPDDVNRVILWLHHATDDVAAFWQANIRSPGKLRQRWDQMREQYERSSRPKRNGAYEYAMRRAAEVAS